MISDELRNYLLGKIKEQKDCLVKEQEKLSRFETRYRYIHSFICIDGVLDKIVFDGELGKFTELRAKIAESGISAPVFTRFKNEPVVNCDTYTIEVIDLSGIF